jgi:hypothetical protein
MNELPPRLARDPEDFYDVTWRIYSAAPAAPLREHMAAIMKHYGGRVNPVNVVRRLKSLASSSTAR